MEEYWIISNASDGLLTIGGIVVIAFFLFSSMYFGLEWLQNKLNFNLRKQLKTIADSVAFLLLFFAISFTLNCLIDLCFMQDIKLKINFTITLIGVLITGTVILVKK